MRNQVRARSWLALSLTALILLGCGSIDKTQEANDGVVLYFRSADLLAMSDQALPSYPSTPAGEAGSLGRDFPDAPPQIPHTTEDMYPITLDDNECLECHLPENAGRGDVPLPKSHFQAPVMVQGGSNDSMAWIVKDYEETEDPFGGRYNCNMCHTPQADNVDTPTSTFVSARMNQLKRRESQGR
jgi:cytochrome c-type protein NapB